MLPVLQRSSPLLDHRNRQPVPVGLTNTQMSLISDTDVDHLAALLERVQTVLKAHECSHELQTHEGLPRMLPVGSWLDRGIVRKHTPNEDSLFIVQSILHSSQ